MNFLKNLSKVISGFIILILISAFFPIGSANALMMSPAQPFGGRIKSIMPCIKPPGLILTVGPPKGGQFFLSLNSKIYDYGFVMPGVWVLGSAISAPVVCKGLKKNVGGFKLANSSKANLDSLPEPLPVAAHPGEIVVKFNVEWQGKALSMLGISFSNILRAVGIKIGSFSSDDLKKLNAGGGIIIKIGTSRF